MLGNNNNTGSPSLLRRKPKFWPMNRESLPPKKKAQTLANNAAAHQKHREFLPPKEMAQIFANDAASCKN
jgi:hypothetical protein